MHFGNPNAVVRRFLIHARAVSLVRIRRKKWPKKEAAEREDAPTNDSDERFEPHRTRTSAQSVADQVAHRIVLRPGRCGNACRFLRLDGTARRRTIHFKTYLSPDFHLSEPVITSLGMGAPVKLLSRETDVDEGDEHSVPVLL